ncbi:MAG: hypothetical protein ACLSFK_09310 [Streptococcus salivarius]|uniref:hypothetical protein n=1 Tax=Streptococcus salivarius TaxID=1304 RepID=UPI001581430B|nr:hypothetical protein [Streptococcus salivarius]
MDKVVALLNLAVDMLALVSTVIGIAIAVYGINTYYGQKRFDEKLRVYKAYISIVANSTLDEVKQHETNLVQTHILHKQELVLFAPQEIVDLAGEIEPMDFTKKNPDMESDYKNYLLLLNMMRADLMKSNRKVSEKTLRKLLG